MLVYPLVDVAIVTTLMSLDLGRMYHFTSHDNFREVVLVVTITKKSAVTEQPSNFRPLRLCSSRYYRTKRYAPPE
jgi:hypothetical protein